MKPALLLKITIPAAATVMVILAAESAYPNAIWNGFDWGTDLSTDQTQEEVPEIAKIESWGWKYMGKHLGTDGKSMRWEFLDPDPKNRHHGVPCIVDVKQFCTDDEFGIAGTAAETEATDVYNWLTNGGKLNEKIRGQRQK